MIECREVVDSLKQVDNTTTSFNKPEPITCSACEELEKEFAKNPGGLPMRNRGLFFVALTGGSAIALSVICLPFVTPAFRQVCLPYVPATTAQVNNVIKALLPKKVESTQSLGKLIDIGSGDGRIVLETAAHGFQSHGVELNPWLVAYSRYRSIRLGLRSRASFSRQDLWKTDFAPYQNVVIFGVEEMMPQLEQKLSAELQTGSRVVACRFPFPYWQPDSIVGEGIDSVWLYKMNHLKSSTSKI